MPEKPKGGRPPRRAGELLSKNRTFRVRAELDAALNAASAKSGRSVSEEIERRLERSFEVEDFITAALGGPALRSHALSMLAAFASGGERVANGRPAEEWLKDPECYRSAVISAAASLIEPISKPEDKELVMLALISRAAQQLLRSGKLKFDYGNGPVGSGFNVGPREDGK